MSWLFALLTRSAQLWTNRVGYTVCVKRLAATISRELETSNQCGVYEAELARVWRIEGVKRQKLVEQFAKEHGWTVAYYKDGLVAIFTKTSPSKRN